MPDALRVLLVDDNPDDRALVARELRREYGDVGVREVIDQDDLASALDEAPYDLVITDYQLRWSDGLTILHAVRQRLADIPTVMFTGTGSEEIAVEAMKNGLDDYVVKSPKHFKRLVPATRRAIERAAHRRERNALNERVRTILDGLLSGVYRTSPEGVLLYANPAMVRLLGYPEGTDITGTSIRKHYVNPDDRDSWRELVERNRTVRHFETAMHRVDGTVCWVSDSTRRVDDADGNLLYYEGVLEDVTERKLAEEAVRRQTAFLQLLNVVTRAANEVAGFEEALRLAVTEVCMRTGWPVGHVYLPVAAAGGIQLIPAPIWHMSEPERFRRFQEVTADAFFAPGEVLPGRVLATGRPEWIESLADDRRFAGADLAPDIGLTAGFAVPVFVGREPVAVLEFYHTERRPREDDLLAVMGQIGTQLGRVAERERAEDKRQEIEEQVRQAQKMEAVGRLAGGVAHDFNNLLTVIVGECDLMLDQPGLDPAVREAVEDVRRAAERGALLTRQLLAFSRRQLVEPDVFSPNDLVRDLGKMFRRLIGENIGLETRLSPNVAEVFMDRGQLEQVLVNLVVNARDAMPDGGSVAIETSTARLAGDEAQIRSDVKPGDYTVIAVSDTGAGMSAEVKEHLFEPFFTTKGPGKGTGLGLATSYGIIRQAGGHIGVYSEQGYGSTIRLYLPRSAESRRAQAAPRTSGPMPQGTETVLVVEDDEALRGVATRILERLGYTVLRAESARAALALLDGPVPSLDLLLTDVVLPDIGGRELADRVLAAFPKAKVLFSSGYTEDVILRHRLLEGDVQFLRKPFTVDDLARRVRQVLDG